jgi:hypothetical protein
MALTRAMHAKDTGIPVIIERMVTEGSLHPGLHCQIAVEA